MKNEPKGIQSIEKGFMILEVLMNSTTSVSLVKIAERIEFSPSKVHSYLVSFMRLGMIQQNPDTGFYSLGPKSLHLGLGYLNQTNLSISARPLIEKLAENLGQTIFLGVWGNKGPTIVYRVDGVNSHAIFDLRIGSVLPLLTSALGMNFTAHLPFSLVENFIQKELKNKSSLGLFKNMTEVKKECENIVASGIAVSKGRLLTDFTAISAPIFDFSGTISAALTVMGSISELNDSPTGKEAQLLKKVVEEISASRGYKPSKK